MVIISLFFLLLTFCRLPRLLNCMFIVCLYKLTNGRILLCQQFIVYYNNVVCSVLQMWNNVIAIDFMSKDFTKEWRETFTLDFEGKYQQVFLTHFQYACLIGLEAEPMQYLFIYLYFYLKNTNNSNS